MSTNIRFPIILTCFFLIFLTMPINSFAFVNIPRSAALQIIFNQTEATYLSRVPGGTTQNAINEMPDLFAILVGLTMQRQKTYLYVNSSYGAYIPQYELLADEAISFMVQLARAHNYRHPTNGGDLYRETLVGNFYGGLNGDYNAKMTQAWGFDPATVGLPFMLSEVSLPQDTGGGDVAPLPRLHVKKGNEINLLEELAPPAETSEFYSDETPPASQLSPAALCNECPKLQPGNERQTETSCDGGRRLFCRYLTDGRLYSKGSMLYDKLHGSQLDYKMEGTTLYLANQEYYEHGQHEGIKTQYQCCDSSKQVYMSWRGRYENGQLMEREMFSCCRGGKSYLLSSCKWNSTAGACVDQPVK